MSLYYTVNFKDKWIFTAPPKTATSSIRRCLANHVSKGPRIDALKKLMKTPNHQPLSVFKKHIPDYDELYKFGCVRNPYDRIVSLWCERGPIYKIKTFKEFVMRMKMTSDYETHTIPMQYQHEWFDDDTFIIKFETLNEDWDIVCKNIKVNAKLNHIRKAHNRDKFRAYYDAESSQHVYDTFREDFDLFGYEFEKFDK